MKTSVLSMLLIFLLTAGSAMADRGLLPARSTEQSRTIAANSGVCKQPNGDLRYTVSGAQIYGNSCDAIVQAAGSGPVSVEFDLERLDPSAWAGHLPLNEYWVLKSYSIGSLTWYGGNGTAAPSFRGFTIDLNNIRDRESSDISTTPIGDAQMTILPVIEARFDSFSLGGTPLGPKTVNLLNAVSTSMTFYRQTQSRVTIDGYYNTMKVATSDVVIEGTDVRLVPRSGVSVTPAAPHVIIFPEQATTDADGIAAFRLFPYPPFDSSDSQFPSVFEFQSDLKDRIYPRSAGLSFGRVVCIAGNVQGAIQGDHISQDDVHVLGKSGVDFAGRQQYPSVSLMLNDSSLFTLASRNDAVEGSSLRLSVDTLALRQAEIDLQNSIFSDSNVKLVEWGIQRLGVKQILGLSPYSFAVRMALGYVVNFGLDRLRTRNVLAAAGASPRGYGDFHLSGTTSSSGVVVADNWLGSTPVTVDTFSPFLNMVLPPGGRLTIDTRKGTWNVTSIPKLCPYPHPIGIQLASGSPLTGTITSRAPDLRVSAALCPYIDGTLQITVDGNQVFFTQRTSPTDYIYVNLVPASYLSSGHHTLRVSFMDIDGQVQSATAEFDVSADAGLPAFMPQGIAVFPGAGSVGLRWLAGDPSVTAGFHVYRTVGATTTRLTGQPVLSPLFFDTTLPPGATGIYTVTSVSLTGLESDGSAAMTGTLAAPGAVMKAAEAGEGVLRGTERSIEMSFASGPAVGWRVERATSAVPGGASPGVFAALGGSNGVVTVRSARDTTVVPGTPYWYRITPIGPDNVPGTAAIFGPVTTTDVPPPVPTNVNGMNDRNRARLWWMPADASDVAGYFVYRAGSSGEFERMTNTPVQGTAFDDFLPATALPYWYRVTSVDSSGQESEASAPVMISYAIFPAVVYVPDAVR